MSWQMAFRSTKDGRICCRAIPSFYNSNKLLSKRATSTGTSKKAMPDKINWQLPTCQEDAPSSHNTTATIGEPSYPEPSISAQSHRYLFPFPDHDTTSRPDEAPQGQLATSGHASRGSTHEARRHQTHQQSTQQKSSRNCETMAYCTAQTAHSAQAISRPICTESAQQKKRLPGKKGVLCLPAFPIL